MNSSDTFPAPSFVLGVPRSGTTWLVNILDSSPNTLLIVEPFSILNAEVMRQIPPTSLFLVGDAPKLENYFKTDFLKTCLKHKFLSSNNDCRIRRFKYERTLSWFAKKIGRKIYMTPPRRVRVFEQLNLNRIGNDLPLFPKNKQANRWIIKELRAAGKVNVLQSAFPDSKFVVLIRHPCATVHSILKWFSRGRLGELKNELISFNAALRSQVVGNKYLDLIDHVEKAKDPASQVALYWRVHYETLVESLAANPNAMVIQHEELAIRPIETTKTILRQFDIPFSTSIERYLEKSTKATGNDSNPLSTMRDSKTYYRQWHEEIDSEVRTRVEAVVKDSPLMDYFSAYYS